MPLQERPTPRRTARSKRLPMTALSLRSAAVLAAFAFVAAACSSPGASSAWSYGPSLAPAASGSAAPSAAASSAAPSPSVVPSAPASPVASAGGSAAPSGAVTKLTIGTKTGAELEFDPDSAKVPTGVTVSITFENRATLPHNLTFKAPINAATDPVVAPGTSATIEFTAPAPGMYAWACTIHPVMQGKLEVDPAS
ncbi:MAG: Cupredoxin-like domain [Chloroflexota bacterium]|nr:Cupredoxin-like domain [Chloroflexota bacterium]